MKYPQLHNYREVSILGQDLISYFSKGKFVYENLGKVVVTDDPAGLGERREALILK